MLRRFLSSFFVALTLGGLTASCAGKGSGPSTQVLPRTLPPQELAEGSPPEEPPQVASQRMLGARGEPRFHGQMGLGLKEISAVLIYKIVSFLV